ncbi:hypothetical protein HN51_007868 [Arachis hypogaea]
MKFTYVLSGWEGTTSDSRILKDALSRKYPLRIPEGKFYLGDAGFMLKLGILTLYREANQPSKDNLRWSDKMDEVQLNALAEEASKGETTYRKMEKMQIRHYDVLKELFGADRTTGKGAVTSSERIEQLDRDRIDLNDSFEKIGFFDIDINMGHDTPTFSANLDSPSAPYSHPNQLGGTSTSRGTKRKSPMNDFLEAQYEKVALGITTIVNTVKEGSYLSSKLHDVAQRQVESVEKQASMAERLVLVAEKQVLLIERQVVIIEKGWLLCNKVGPAFTANQIYGIC